MTPTQRETIREVIGHLWTLEEAAGTETMSGNYAEQLTDMLAVDKPEEVKPPRGKWVDVEPAPNGLLYATCSVCGKRQTVEAVNYCGNCGTRMEGEEE